MIIQNSAGDVVSFNSSDPRLGEYMSGFTGAISMLGQTGSLSHRRIYETELWVNVCVNKLARGIARLPLKVYKREGENRTRMRSEGDDLARLIHTPYPGGSTFDLVEQYTHEYLVHGSGPVALLQPTPGAPPDQMIPIDWEFLTAYFIGGRLAYYTWYRDGMLKDPVKLLPEEVIDFGYYRRRSPLGALALTLQLENAAKRQLKSWFEGGAKMAAVITSGATSTGVARAMKRDEVKNVEAQLVDQHGGPDKAFRLALLTSMPDARIQTLEHDAEALQLTETRRINREEAAAAYDIPPPMIGILDRATFSNIDTQTRMLAVHTFAPHTEMQQQRFGARLLQRFPKWRQHFIEFDYTKLLEASPLEQAEADVKGLMSGKTPNELRRRRNDPAITDPWADAIYIPANLVPIGAPGPLRNAGVQALELMAAAGDNDIDDARLAQMVRDLVTGPPPATVTTANGNGNGKHD